MTTLKKLLGEAGAGLDESYEGANRLYEVLKKMVQSQSESVSAFQATIATETLMAMVADAATKLTSLRASVGTTGTADATTVQIHVNGNSKGEVTIDNTDADGTKKAVSLAIDIAEGDLLELVVSAAPTGGADLAASARLQPITVE